MRLTLALGAGLCLLGGTPTLAKAQVFSAPIAGSPYRGPAHAPVTIVLACQYTGRYCNKIRPTMDRLFRTYYKKIKLVYKHFPVHTTRALPSHLAACAAHRQGKFRRMHNALWQAYPQRRYDAGSVRKLAIAIGLNMKRFDRDVMSFCPGLMRRERKQMSQLGVRGTPGFFINGRRFSGAQPFSKITTIVAGELALARQRLRRGTKLRNYYTRWVLKPGAKRVLPRTPRTRPAPTRPRPRRGRPNPTAVYSIPVGTSPFIGPRDAKVTVVVSMDFRSPHSNRIRTTLEQLHNKYKNDLRIVFKHFVVHASTATRPALAACAAHQQGRFFAMETKIWASNQRNSAAELRKIARSLNLDMLRFGKDMKGRCQRQLQTDYAEFSRVGVAGVPASFINGRYLGGNVPAMRFEKIINEELRKANRRIRRGARKNSYYRNFVERRGRRTP